MCQSPSLPYLHIPRLSLANISLQYRLLGTRSRPMETKKLYFLFFKENVCSGYSLEAALSNVNDSFTLSRLMKRPKHFVIRHVMSTHNLHFFVKYTESVSTIFNPIRRRTPTFFKCCSLIFDRIHMLKFSSYVAEVMNSVDYESTVHLDLLARNTYTYPNSFGCIFIYVWVSAITIIN